MSDPTHDQAARQRIRTDLSRSVLVEAAAGTGKTTILVERLVEVLATGGARINEVVAVTFTKKAAGELKLRLRQELDRARSVAKDGDRRANLASAIARLEEAVIGTIHSLCAEVLRQRPVEAGIDPAFTEIDEEESSRLFATAFQGWIEHKLEELPEGLARALSRLAVSRSFDGSTPLERLCAEGRRLLEWRDYPRQWERRHFDRDGAIDQMLEHVAAMAGLYRGNEDPRDPLRQALAPAWQLHEWVRRSEEVADRDYDTLEARLIEALRALRRQARKKGRGAWPVQGISRAEVSRQRDTLIETLEEFRTRADADLAALLRTDLLEVVERYEELKLRNGQLDFLDLLIRARDLVRDRPDVRRHLQSRFQRIFVDEFQDTDALQIEILLLLAADDPTVSDWTRAVPAPGKLFLVGDPKQSIYRFRRADVVLYQQVKQRLKEAGVRQETLSHSWRAVQPLQQTINAAFAAEMTGDPESGQPDYVPMQHEREAIESQPAVVALPIPRPYSHWGRVTVRKINDELPEVVAAYIEWLVNHSGWSVQDPEDKASRVPIRPRHIGILFRRFLSWRSDVTRPYLAALEARGIPHLLSGGRSFHQREEVETLRAALTAIEWPDDELSVFATLKGSLFAISDAALLRFRHQHGALHPFRSLPEDLNGDLRPITEVLALLARLHRQRNRVPIARTLQDLLSETRAHAGFGMRPAGNQVLANVQRVVDLARSFELRGGLSFRGFVQRLSDEAERPGSTEAPLLEEGAEGVRIMTVHGAKGLEFPVVVLADITAQLARAEPSAFIDPQARLCATRILGCAPWELIDNAERERNRDRAESVRLTYVAATRARDLLVVPALGEYAWDDGWVSPLNRSLYPPREQYRRSRSAPGCPPFGERTVLERPHRAAGETETSIKPGLHRAESGEEVVWWDPALLQLNVPHNFGLRQEELLAEGDRDAVAAGTEIYERWMSRRQEAQARGSVPEFEVIVVSETDQEPDDVGTEVLVERVERRAKRPAGPRFGTLVHTVLRDVPYGAQARSIEQLVAMHGRALGAPEPEQRAAVQAVGAALEHPLLVRASAAAQVHREAPFTLRLQDGRVVEGVLDLLFQEGGAWTVVDFKTDADPDLLLERYRNQALWYGLAVDHLLGGAARVVLLSV